MKNQCQNGKSARTVRNRQYKARCSPVGRWSGQCFASSFSRSSLISSTSSFRNISPKLTVSRRQENQMALAPQKFSATLPRGCAQREQEDDGEVVERLVLGGAVARHEPTAQRVHAAAQVTDTHRGGIAIAVYLTEGLYLHRTGEGDEGVGHQIPFLRGRSPPRRASKFSHSTTNCRQWSRCICRNFWRSSSAAKTPSAKKQSGTR